MATGEQESLEYWKAAAGLGETTLVLGVGFDPRALAVARILHAGGMSPRVIAVNIPSENDRADMVVAATSHWDELNALSSRVEKLTLGEINDGRNAGVLVARALFAAPYQIQSAPHIILDVSSLPASIYFPLIAVLADMRMPNGSTPDVQVTASENFRIDALITPIGFEEPTYILPFKPSVDAPAAKVWIPVLGESRSPQLNAIRDYLQPDEVCPVLPFPSAHARRADNLLTSYRSLLFDELELEPRNVLYANERNPFDLYRQLAELKRRYSKAMEPLGSASLVLSQHSSKLLSIGAVLAAHEHGLAVMHARPTGYIMSDAPSSECGVPEITTLWLTGRPYEDPSVSGERDALSTTSREG